MFVAGSVARKLSPQDQQAESLMIRVPATGGELWQGTVDDRLIMVNSPISYFGEVMIKRRLDTDEVLAPEDSRLIREAAELVRDQLGRSDVGLEIRILNPVPRGLGMASSTTETVASAFGVARLLGCDRRSALALAHQMVCRFDSGNDHNYLPGIQVVDPRRGLVISSFPEVPTMRILLVNTGGHLDTSAMDRDQERSVGRRFKGRMEDSLARILRGLALHDLDLIGAASTENARIYQEITPKPHFDEVFRLLMNQPGALGLATGHSGTVIGVLLRENAPGAILKQELISLYGQQNMIGEYTLISGGVHEYSRVS